MPIHVTCRCGKRFQAVDGLAGKRVSCPACGQPLAIPSTNVPSAAVGSPLDLDDFPPVEQPAAASAGRHAQSGEGIHGWLIAAMCVAGGVVLLALGGIVLSPLWSSSGGAARERPVGEAAKNQPAAVARPPVDHAVTKTGQGSNPPAAEPQSPRPEMRAAEVTPKPVVSGAGESSAPARTPAPPGRPTPQPGAIQIKLSAGTALPQSLPTGTAMGFSVDYEFVSGRPDASAEYFWVIKSAQGRTVKQSVHLGPRGTLQGFVLEFQPEHGPFQTCLEDAQGRRLTGLAPLR